MSEECTCNNLDHSENNHHCPLNAESEHSATSYNSIGRAKEGSTDVWVTPDYVVEFAKKRWNDGKDFDMDAAAGADNAQAPIFIDEETDALKVNWQTHYVSTQLQNHTRPKLVANGVWLNPPYGRAMPKFLKKAQEEVEKGRVKRVVCLIACRTDTKVFHELIFEKAAEVFFIKGRISFSGKGPANFASCFVVFDNDRNPAGPRINYDSIKGES